MSPILLSFQVATRETTAPERRPSTQSLPRGSASGSQSPQVRYTNSRKERAMQNSHLWQAALVVGLCVLTNPVLAQEPSPKSPRVEQMPSAPHEQAQTEADH